METISQFDKLRNQITGEFNFDGKSIYIRKLEDGKYNLKKKEANLVFKNISLDKVVEYLREA